MTPLRKVCLAIGACAALVGCTGAPDGAEPSPAVEQPTASAVARVEPEAVRPEASRSIKVGLIEPLSGPYVRRGVDSVDGLNLYLDSIRSNVDDRTVEAVVADSHGTMAGAAASAADLVARQHVSLLLGLGTAEDCESVAAFADQRSVPLAITGYCPLQKLAGGPYVARFTQPPSGVIDTAADWAAKNGFRHAILLTTDSRAGIQVADAFASAFIARGGHIAQELHPPPGTSDFSAYIARFTDTADLVAFLTEPDDSGFSAQYPGSKQVQVLDLSGRSNTRGVVDITDYVDNFDTPVNRAFVKAWTTRYPGRALSLDAASGYASGQLLTSVLKQADGNANNGKALLQALYYADTETVKGRVRLDKQHASVQNTYVSRMVNQGNGVTRQLLQTYTDVGPDWDRTLGELASFDFGGHKDTWVRMNRERLGNAVTRRSLYQFFGPSEIR